MRELTIGRLARAAGVHVETVRYYERRRLLARPARGLGFRVYPPEAIRRIRFIKRAQGLGFSLREIRELLAMKAAPRIGCAGVKRRAEEKIVEIEAKVRTLESMQAALRGLVRECDGSGPATDCPILEALDSEGEPPAGAGATTRGTGGTE